MALTSVICCECMGGKVHDGQGQKTAFREPPPSPVWSLSYALKPFPLPPPEPGSLNNSFGLHLFSGLFLVSQICKNHPKLKKKWNTQTSKTLSALSFRPLVVELLPHPSAEVPAEVTVASQRPDSCLLSSYLYPPQHLRLLNTHSFLISAPTLVSAPLHPLEFPLYILLSNIFFHSFLQISPFSPALRSQCFPDNILASVLIFFSLTLYIFQYERFYKWSCHFCR